MANLVPVPEDIAAGAWGKSNAAADDNVIIARDGFQTADLLKDSNIGGTGAVRAQDVVDGLTASSAHIYSGFIKRAQLDWGLLQLAALSLAGGDPSIYVDAANGVIGTEGPNVDASGIEDYGNGWWRAWFTFTTNTDVSGLQRIYPVNGDSDTIVDLDGTSSIYWWGLMLETGTTLNPYVSENGITVVPATGSAKPGIGLGFGKMGRMGS